MTCVVSTKNSPLEQRSTTSSQSPPFYDPYFDEYLWTKRGSKTSINMSCEGSSPHNLPKQSHVSLHLSQFEYDLIQLVHLKKYGGIRSDPTPSKRNFSENDSSKGGSYRSRDRQTPENILPQKDLDRYYSAVTTFLKKESQDQPLCPQNIPQLIKYTKQLDKEGKDTESDPLCQKIRNVLKTSIQKQIETSCQSSNSTNEMSLISPEVAPQAIYTALS